MKSNPLTAMTTRAAPIARTVGFFALALLVSGCDSDGNSARNIASIPVPVFAGTVSTPQGIAEPFIAIKSPQGDISEAPVDEFGRFTVTTAAAGDQYLMRADLGNANYLYSIGHLPDNSGNRQNIHSYTDLIARTWFADLGLDINSVFASAAGIDYFPTKVAIDSIDANVQAIVSDVLEEYGLTNVSLSKASYDATDTGIDRFLNENPVIIRDNRATIIVNDPQTNLQATAVDSVRLPSFGELDVSQPDQPQNVRALGTLTATNADTEESAIVLAWSNANDNIGIATYEIYRDENLIGHTPFPLYRDSNVYPGTDYSYTVVTIDESNNRSIPSVMASGRALSDFDNTSPATPSSATLNASTQRIDVFWAHENTIDLARFEVTRTGGDGILVREVTSTQLSDIIVASGTEYCYEIVAVDASDNRSEPNPRSCITTSGAAVDSQDQIASPVIVQMAQDSISGPEGSLIIAYVNRLGDSTGEISIDYVVTPGTATAEEDYVASDGSLVWGDGDITAKQITISLLPDNETEGTETLSVVLASSSTDAVISKAVTTVNIVDLN